jgi:hypothetical protein
LQAVGLKIFAESVVPPGCQATCNLVVPCRGEGPQFPCGAPQGKICRVPGPTQLGLFSFPLIALSLPSLWPSLPSHCPLFALTALSLPSRCPLVAFSLPSLPSHLCPHQALSLPSLTALSLPSLCPHPGPSHCPFFALTALSLPLIALSLPSPGPLVAPHCPLVADLLSNLQVIE